MSKLFYVALAMMAVSAVAAKHVSMFPVEWTIPINGMGASLGSAVSQDKNSYFTADSQHVFAVDIPSRQVKWKFELGVFVAESATVGMQTVAGIDAVFFGGVGSVGIIALNGTTGKMLWANTTFNAPSSAVPASPGKIFVNVNNNFAAVDAMTGELAWVAPLGGDIMNSAVSPNGMYFVAYSYNYNYGTYAVTAISAATGKTLWSTPSTVTLQSYYGLNDKHVAVSAYTYMEVYDSSTGYYTNTDYNDILVLDISTGAVVANISCGHDNVNTGSTSNVDSNGRCNGAALYSVGTTSMLTYITGNGTLYTANITAASSAQTPLVATTVYSFGGPNFVNSGNTITLSATSAGIAAVIGGYSGGTNLTLIPTDGSGSTITISGIPSGPNGVSVMPLGGKCIISTNVQGFIVFSVADGSVLGRDEDAPGITSIISLGGSSIVLPGDAEITAYSTQMCA